MPEDGLVERGPATLLAHGHDERLDHMYNALVRGDPRRTQRSTDRYLGRRGLRRPKVQ
ncbi:hypothetical protein ACFXD5_05350 [Streptomyces sp. NPDC059385]|uniref:hypothetical protein n=1 Tax=Streptomyces sp. NPDC059385 TaxID=3346817 RepID=UPI00369BB1F1